MRFAPPANLVDAEVRWLLVRAFGPRDQTLPEIAAERACDLAEGLGLGSPISARHDGERLQQEIGAEGAARLGQARHRAVAAALMFEDLAQRLLATAQRLEIPVLFLKGFALNFALDGAAGWRPFGDLDVLAPQSRSQELFAALLEEGFRSSEVLSNDQHLPPLLGPTAGSVDLHYRLRGITLGQGRWATAEELAAAGLVRAFDGGRETLAPELLAAHVLSHGLEQHGDRPDSYPMLRLVGDLLALTGPTGDPRTTVRQALEWTTDSLRRDEAEALGELCGHLQRGELPFPDRDADVLLRHFIAGALVPGYGDGRRLDHARGRLREARRQGRLGRHLWRKLWLNRRELELRYGKARSPWSHWGWRLRRPFDILWSLVRPGADRP
ncbi:MAG: nucleotidyltransferase family protein [Acidobacteriota bacterium]